MSRVLDLVAPTMQPTESAMFHQEAIASLKHLYCAVGMAISRGAEELYLQEARLERQYKDCEPLLKSISTIISSKPTNDAEALSEPSKRAVRRLCGFWDR